MKQSIASKKQAIAERDKNLKNIRDRLAVLKKKIQNREDAKGLAAIIKRDMKSDIRNNPRAGVDKMYSDLIKYYKKKYENADINEVKKELNELKKG